MTKNTKYAVAMTLGGLGALGFMLMGLEVVPREPAFIGAMICVVLSGIVWALPAREV